MQYRYMQHMWLGAAAALTLGLSACANIPASYNTQAEVGGGIVGGVVGNALCGGVLCTAVGALGGAYAGHELARNGAFGERHVATGPAYGPTRPYAYETPAPAPVRPLHTIRHRHIRHHVVHHHVRHHRHHTY